MRAKFLRERTLSILDNLLAEGVIFVLPIVIGLTLKFILRLEINTFLLVSLMICQILIFLMLFSIWRKLSSKLKWSNQLVQESGSDNIYLIDRFGLPHPINDEDTVLYFKQVLDYETSELLEVSPSELKPTGPEVVGIRKWRPPDTIENKMSAEARRTLKLLKKDIRTEDSLKILTFYLRNDSEHSIRINSAELVFDADAPVTEADVSPANKPVHRGFLVCKLLFNRKSESMKLIPQEDINLDLLLQRNLTEDESAAIISRKLGYIRFAGVFRESEVNFHKDA